MATFVEVGLVQRVEVEEVGHEGAAGSERGNYLGHYPKPFLIHAAAVNMCVKRCRVVEVMVLLVCLAVDHGAVVYAMFAVKEHLQTKGCV